MNAQGGRRLKPLYCALLSRALLKCALECAWLDDGEAMLEDRFDHVRDAILGQPRDGFFILVSRRSPDKTSIDITYDFATDGNQTTRVWVIADFYGIRVGTDSRLTTPEIGDILSEWGRLG